MHIANIFQVFFFLIESFCETESSFKAAKWRILVKKKKERF